MKSFGNGSSDDDDGNDYKSVAHNGNADRI